MGQMDWDILYDYANSVGSEHPLYGFSKLLADESLRADLQQVLRKHNATGYNGYLLRKCR